MNGYKAFNKDMTCKGFQFKEGETYEEKEAIYCESGFHFCTNLLDVLNYYSLTNSKFYHVKALGKISKGDTIYSNASTTKIKIGKEIKLAEFVELAIEECKKGNKTSNGVGSKLANSEDYSKLVSSEDYSKLISLGVGSQLSSSGYYSRLVSSGDYSKLANSGDHSQLSSSGNCSRLSSSGRYSKLASSGAGSTLSSSGTLSQLSSSGDSSKLVSSGIGSKLASSGVGSRLSSSGGYSTLSSSGDYSKLASSGVGSQLEINGANSIGVNIGLDGRIKGKKGSWITLAEYEYDIPICIKTAKIDGEELKEDTWYQLKNKKFVEV